MNPESIHVDVRVAAEQASYCGVNLAVIFVLGRVFWVLLQAVKLCPFKAGEFFRKPWSRALQDRDLIRRSK